MTDENTDSESDRATTTEKPDESADEFESERTATRAEAAAVLRGLADGVDAGAVAIGAGEDAVTATVPDEFDFELEYETDGDEVEIEVELEWTREDEPPASDVVPDDTSAGTADPGDGSESASDGDEPSGAEIPDDERPAVETATVAATADGDETSSESGSDGQAGADSDGQASPESDQQADTADALATPVAEPVAPLSSQARFEVYRDRANEWRWRLVHRNGNVIAASGEGYTRRHNAEKGLRSVVRNAPDAEVVEDDR